MNPALDDTALSEEDLLQLQLRIAQRADALAQSQDRGRNRLTDRDCWLEAEREELARFREPSLVSLS